MNEQIIVNSIISASVVVLAGVSFFLPFSVARFFHFTHGAAFAIGAYTAFVLAQKVRCNLWFAAAAGVLVSAFLGIILDVLVFRRMQRTGTSAFVLLLASLGAYVLLQNILSLVFGDAAMSIAATHAWKTFAVMGARITAAQVLQITTALILVIILRLYLKNSATGRAMGAVGHDRFLAQCVGISPARTTTLAFGCGYGLAGLAGVLSALNVDVVPTMGMNPMMLAMVAVIIGGNTFLGTVCGALLIGFAQNFGIIWLPTQWQSAIVFIILLFFLLLRPQGFSNRPVKKATI